MMDKIGGPGMDGGHPVRRPEPSPRPASSAPARESQPEKPDLLLPGLQGRLRTVAGNLEQLLERLTTVQDRARAGRSLPQDVAEGEDLQRSISAAQIAFQNILSADPETPAAPPGSPPVHDINRANVLKLLEL